MEEISGFSDNYTENSPIFKKISTYLHPRSQLPIVLPPTEKYIPPSEENSVQQQPTSTE